MNRKEVTDWFFKGRITAQYIHIKPLKTFNVKFILGNSQIYSSFFPHNCLLQSYRFAARQNLIVFVARSPHKYSVTRYYNVVYYGLKNPKIGRGIEKYYLYSWNF